MLTVAINFIHSPLTTKLLVLFWIYSIDLASMSQFAPPPHARMNLM